MTPTEQFIAEQRHSDPAFQAVWDGGEPAFRLRQALIYARVDAGLTQTELAKRLGTHQSAIARMEAGRVKPSFDILMRYAAALGVRFEIDAGQVSVTKSAA